MIIEFAHNNDGLAIERSREFSVDFTDAGDLCVQSDSIDADINTLVQRFGLTIDSPQDPRSLEHYGDFSGLTDYHTATQLVLDAQNAFAELPANVRFRFQNDPGQLLDFLHDPQNAKEAAKLGLLTSEAANALLTDPIPDPIPVPQDSTKVDPEPE